MDVHELAREPSPESWRLLCQELDRMAEPDALATIDALEPALAAWPDELRATMCGMSWDDQFFDGRPNPRSSIVRLLRFDRYFSGRYDHSLRMRSRRLDAATMRNLGRSPGVRHLTRIDFGHQLDGNGVIALAAGTHFEKLAHLDIAGAKLADVRPALEALARAEFYGRLEVLNLASCGITRSDVGSLFREGGPKELALDDNPLGQAGAVTIAAQLRDRPVRLGLASCDIGDAGARGLAAIGPRLERLVLDKNAITDAGVRALATGRLSVAELSLANNQITSDGVKAVVETGWPLTKLELGDNALDDAAAQLLADRAPDSLTALDIDDNDVTATGLMALLGSRQLVNLRSLDASTNRIGAITSDIAVMLGSLEILRLAHNRLGDGVRGLAAISSDALTHLDLSNNTIGIRALEELTGATWFSRLIELDLSHNALGPGAGVVFGTWPIERLDLSDTELGDAGAGALFDAGLRPKTLELDRCELTDRALEALAASPTLERLEILSINGNAVTDAGVRALIAAAPRRLLQVKVGNNRVGDAGVVALAQWPQLLYVAADGNPFAKRGQAALDARPVRCCP